MLGSWGFPPIITCTEVDRKVRIRGMDITTLTWLGGTRSVGQRGTAVYASWGGTYLSACNLSVC